MKPTYSLSVLFFLLLSVLPSPAQKSTHNFEVAKNLDIFNALYRELDLYYVDTLDAKKNIDNALAYMLEMLDPYTEYYPEEETSSLQELTTGKYAGIGTMIGYSEAHRRCIVSKPYAGMPAAQAGLLPGDIILAIDGEDIQPLENPTEERIADYTEQVSGKLRGEAGITLELKIRRPEQNKVFTFKLVRRNILMPSVSLAAMVTDSIGYICLTQFIEGTSNEIRRALVELKQQGARSLILDLRDNPGGVMEEAVKTVNLFIPRGREVVSTRGKVKELNAVYKTQIDPQDPDIPLIILTNEHSASAAEITSGALQDYDRALIMGRRTFESLPKGALPGRENIVVSRQPDYHAEGAKVCASIEQAIAEASMPGECFILGGAQLYASTIDMVDRLYLTAIHARFEGADAFFPAIDPDSWCEVEREDHQADEKNRYNYSFITLERRK